VNGESSYPWRQRALFGFILIGIGLLALFDNFDYLYIESFWHYWPLLLVAFGANKMLDFRNDHHFWHGAGQAAIGLWLFACLEQIAGLNFHNSWPVLLIIWGIVRVALAGSSKRSILDKE
jgi:uncharacterized membrane protein HdeD (DUF308 family)